MALTTVPVELANLDGAVTVNESSADVDFRIESNGNANMFFVDGTNNRIGIGTNSPDNLLHIKTTGSTPSIELEQDAGTSYKGLIKLAGNDLEIRGSSGAMEFYTGNNDGDSSTLAMTIDSSQRLGINTSSPEHALHVVSAGTSNEDGIIKIGGTNANLGFELMYDQSGSTTSTININPAYSGGVLETKITGNVVHKIDNAGHVTMPLQSSVGVNINGSNQDNLAANVVTLDFDDERFDQNSDFTVGTNTFAAPVTGKYLVCVNLYMLNIDTAADYYQLYVATSNKTYYALFDPGVLASDPVYWTLSWSGVVDMDASDTCLFKLNQSGGAAQTDLNNNSYASITLLN